MKIKLIIESKIYSGFHRAKIQKEDQKIGNVQIPYNIWINFKKEIEINFVEPEDDEDWQDYQNDLHAT